MRILVIAATAPEVDPFVAGLSGRTDIDSRLASYVRAQHSVDVLTTGVGMVATAAWCSRALTLHHYDLALNVGLCGTFDRTIPPGTVVHVVTDRLVEMGAEDGAAFLTIQELRLLGDDEFPFAEGRLMNAEPPANSELQRLPAVHGITVNTVHGNDDSIARTMKLVAPQVESMEGAAFMYACLIHRLPFAQVRAVSNVVEKRNRSAWKMGEAIRALGATCLRIVDQA